MKSTFFRKNSYLTAMFVFLIAVFLFFIGNISKQKAKAEVYQTGATVELGYSFDFTDYTLENGNYSGTSVKWYDDIYESSNMRLSADNNLPSLAPGNGNGVIYQFDKNEGYLIYKISASDVESRNKKVFDSLSVTVNGRVFHYGHASCNECKMQVFVALSEEDFQEVSTVNADENGSPLARTFTLTELVAGEEFCFVKIAFVGYADAWVNMLNINIDGTAYYDGYAPVHIQIQDVNQDTLISKNDVVELKSAVATDGTNTFMTVATVVDPNGESVTVRDNQFTAGKVGQYTITYTVNDKGRIYDESYVIYCVNDSNKSGLVSGTYGNYANTEIVKEENYTLSATGSVFSDGDTVDIKGSVGYNLPLNFSDKVAVSFEISKFYENEKFAIAFTSASGADFSGTYKKAGLYYVITTRNTDGTVKYYCDGYYQNGTNLYTLGGVEISNISGVHYLHFTPDGANGVTVLFDSVDLSSIADYSVVRMDTFTTGNDAYVSYFVSDRANVEILNVINFADFSGYDKSVLFDSENYAMKDGGVVAASEDGVRINGSAAYLLPLNFSSKLNVLFKINSLPVGGSFEFALTPNPGIVNFDTKNAEGLYYTFKVEGALLLISSYYQSGNALVSLGQYGYDTLSGDYGFSISQRIDQGVSTYFNGTEVFSYQNYMDVDPSKITDGNNTYISFFTKKADVEITNIVAADGRSPVLTNPYTMSAFTRKTYPATGMVGERFVLPDAVMYDVIDGFMPYTVKVQDSNGNDVNVYTDESGKACFDVQYEGLYSISYISVDYSGNAVTDRRNVTMSIKSGAPVMTFSLSEQIKSFGRQGISIELAAPAVTVDGVREETLEKDVIIKIYHPSGAYIVKRPDESYTPFDIGTYIIIYEIANEVATTYAYFSVNVKVNAEPEDSYEDIMNPENWTAVSDGLMEKTEEGLLIYGEKGYTDTAYCKLPFEMSNGIEITLDLTGLADKAETDNWVSVGIGSTPKYGNFGDPKSGYIYFMLYYQGGTYYTNALYVSKEGTINSLFGPISLGDSGIATLSVEKLLGSSSKTDNVNIYLNHQKTSYGTEELITYSHIVDDENFAYISIHNYGNGSAELAAIDFKSVLITDVTVCDQEAPQFIVSGEIVKEIEIGATVELPTITVTDNLDEGFSYSIMLVDPTGTEINVSEGSFVAEKVGTYYLVLRSYDKSGNYNTVIYEILVHENGGCSSSIQSNASAFTVIVLALCCVGFVRLRRRRQEK